MRLTNELKASVKQGNEETVFTLKRPSNKEMNDFLAERVQAGGGRIKDCSYEARCDLFDKLLIGISGLEDEKGAPVTVEKKSMIPSNWKAGVVFRLFESDEIDIKN